MSMGALAVLLDFVGPQGGAERYWETVIPELARRYEVRLLARVVTQADRFGPEAIEVRWSSEEEPPSATAARTVESIIQGCGAAITAGIFDAAVLRAVRSTVPRFIHRVQDYRAFCPNGNKVYPRSHKICTVRMGSACIANTVLQGCVRGPHLASLRRINERLAVRDAIASADLVVAGSGYVVQSCIRDGIDAGRVAVTPPPLPDDAYASWNVQRPTENAVLFSGRFNVTKGLRSLIRAIGLIPEEKRPSLNVAGAGDPAEEREGRAIAERAGVHVRWLGWLSESEIRETIDRSRVLAVPSLWPEPFGLTGTEAFGRGRPVVAYAVGGIPEWIGGGGAAVPRGDERALAAAIAEITSDETVWNRCARAARAQAERYRLDRHIRTLIEQLDPDACAAMPAV